MMSRLVLVLVALGCLVACSAGIHHEQKHQQKPLTPLAPLTTPGLAPSAELSRGLVHEDTRCADAIQAIATDSAWKGVDAKAKAKFQKEACRDPTPTTCQTYSDIYMMSPTSNGTASTYISQAFATLQCITFPAYSIRDNTVAGCHDGLQVIIHGIKSAESARRHCLAQIHPPCAVYTWSNTSRSHQDPEGKQVTLPANTVAMCSKKLVGHSPQMGTQIGYRLRSYLVRPDTSSRCDEAQGKIVVGIMSSADARTLCDKQVHPPCAGYIWTGPIGIGRNASAEPTPYTVMLCAGFRNYYPTEVPKSQYETGTVVKEYMVHANRKGECSKWSQIVTKWDIYSSLQARLECDLYDGVKGPKCLSYIWNKEEGSVDLCASVPQSSTLPVASNFETAWQRPTDCQQISNRWSVAANVTWGFATSEIKTLYTAMNCNTKPTPCKALSNYYGLSPKVDWNLAVRVPGSIRDLWLQQKCNTSPNQIGIDRQKPAYQSVISSIEDIEQSVKEVDSILRRASLSKSVENQKSMAAEVASARAGLEQAIKSVPDGL